MSSTLNGPAYRRLVEEDLRWLLTQPRTLERDHIEAILRQGTYAPRLIETLAVIAKSHTSDGAIASSALRSIRVDEVDDAKEEARAAATEQYWADKNEANGEPYGTY